MSKSVYFYYTKSTFFDIITYCFKSYDSRKTNNTSIELASGSKIIEEQLCISFRGCHATSPLKIVFLTRKVVWQPLKELQSCSSSILVPPTRAFKWGIVCLSTIITFEDTSSYVKKCPFLLYKINNSWHNYLYIQKLW